jgi:hypothetical protein
MFIVMPLNRSGIALLDLVIGFCTSAQSARLPKILGSALLHDLHGG